MMSVLKSGGRCPGHADLLRSLAQQAERRGNRKKSAFFRGINNPATK
jgi:6-phosphofructokinase